MTEIGQFIKWLGRRIFGGVLNLLALIPKVLQNFREELNEQTTMALLGWLLFEVVSIAVVAVITAACGIDRDHSIPYVMYTIGFGIGILIIVSIQALYDAFKEDQQHLINTLKHKNYCPSDDDSELNQ